MKVVINRCFGGFGLSSAALKRYMALKGRECYFFRHDFKAGTNTPISDDAANSVFASAYDIPNPDDLSAEERDKHYLYVSGCDNLRTDPDLIRVVEELGEKANGECADLKIVKIPNGIDYEIDEYDGLETIHEKHRSWS